MTLRTRITVICLTVVSCDHEPPTVNHYLKSEILTVVEITVTMSGMWHSVVSKACSYQTTQLHILYNCSHNLCLLIRDQEIHLLGGPLKMTLSGTGHNSQYCWSKYVTKTKSCLLVVSRTPCYNLRTRFSPAVLMMVLSGCNKLFPMGSTRVRAFPNPWGWKQIGFWTQICYLQSGGRTRRRKKKSTAHSSTDSGYFT